LIAAEVLTSLWVVAAPMVSVSPVALMPLRSAMRVTSMRSEGEASRCFMVGISVWPPARYRPSLAPEKSLAASARLDGL